jgi:hypothetical protein
LQSVAKFKTFFHLRVDDGKVAAGIRLVDGGAIVLKNATDYN